MRLCGETMMNDYESLPRSLSGNCGENSFVPRGAHGLLRSPKEQSQKKMFMTSTHRSPAKPRSETMDPLGNLIPWIAVSGILALLGVALIERLVPILPSTALLVGLGVAVAEGHWSLYMALWSSTAGSFLGCLSFYGVGLALGEARSLAVLKRTALFLGVSQVQLGRLIVSFRRHEKALAFGSQLIPSVRLIAPGIAGLLRAQPRNFLVATIFGVTLWNSLLIGVGYAVALIDDSSNPSAVAAKVVFVLLLCEGLAAAVWRGVVIWRGNRHPQSSKPKTEVPPDSPFPVPPAGWTTHTAQGRRVAF
jgi:membrane protein DedA with SNARE-associated domain